MDIVYLTGLPRSCLLHVQPCCIPVASLLQPCCIPVSSPLQPILHTGNNTNNMRRRIHDTNTKQLLITTNTNTNTNTKLILGSSTSLALLSAEY